MFACVQTSINNHGDHPIRRPMPAPPSKDGPRINDEIRVPRVLLIDHNGEKQGVMPTSSALEAAEEVGLDLVEVSPNSDPPVCKILDYGKYKFQEQKRRTRRANGRRPLKSKRSSFAPTSTSTTTM